MEKEEEKNCGFRYNIDEFLHMFLSLFYALFVIFYFLFPTLQGAFLEGTWKKGNQSADKYDSILSPVLLYRLEAWVNQVKHKSIIKATDMRYLRWIAGVIKVDRCRNKHARANLKEDWDYTLSCYGQITRLNQDRMIKKTNEVGLGKIEERENW